MVSRDGLEDLIVDRRLPRDRAYMRLSRLDGRQPSLPQMLARIAFGKASLEAKGKRGLDPETGSPGQRRG